MLKRLMITGCCLLLAVAVSNAADSQTVEVGSPAPDFTVTGIDGKEFKLSEVTGSGKHVALMFSRAHW